MFEAMFVRYFILSILSCAGIATSVVMVADAIFPGWSPFFGISSTQNAQGYLEGLDQINEVDFDVLVGGHFTRLGTKEDVQTMIDFFADIVSGAKLGLATVAASDVSTGTGIDDPTNVNTGNKWLLFNELFDRVVEVCYDYVLDSSARGRDWLTDLAGVDLTLRSHCWTIQNFARNG